MLSQITFWISTGKVPSSPALVAGAAVDCIHIWAWIQLRAKETLVRTMLSASVINGGSFSLIPSHWVNMSLRNHWLAPQTQGKIVEGVSVYLDHLLLWQVCSLIPQGLCHLQLPILFPERQSHPYWFARKKGGLLHATMLSILHRRFSGVSWLDCANIILH